MPLPSIGIPRGTVTLSDGSAVEVRGLTRAEVLSMDGLDAPTIEARLVQFGTDTPAEDAQAWYDASPAHDVGQVVDKVMELSKLKPDDPFA